MTDLTTLFDHQYLEFATGRFRELPKPNGTREARRTGPNEEHVNLEPIAFRHRQLVKRSASRLLKARSE